MPPQRTTAKTPVKTERTHEENQERAYIAASRRSDRSLEARIESARRASEIHKKRTGRGLRVTEEDVVNEEMYEEDDDDGPGQMRRMQAYMAMANTGNIFDGRLNSYLLSQVATRNMLMGGGGGGFNPNGNPNQPTTFFSYTPPNPTTTGPAQSPQPAHSFRTPQSPHQPQSMGGMPFHMIQSNSPMFMTTQSEKEPLRVSVKGRGTPSIKTPESPVQQSPIQQSPVSQAQSPMPQSPHPRSMSQSNSFLGDFSSHSRQHSWAGHQAYSYPSNASSMDPMASFYGSNMNLMSPSLPVEAQQMFGTNAFDPTNPNTAYLMNQSHGMPVPPNGISYSYNPNLSSSNNKHGQGRATATGMNQTLSPSSFPGDHNLRGADGETSSAFTPNYSFGTFTPNSSGGTPTNEFLDIFDAEGAQNYAQT